MLICSTISNSNLGGIPSTPGDLLSFISLIFIATISNSLQITDVKLTGL